MSTILKNKPQLSEEQKKVVDCTEPKFSVRASAGAGKTKVLVDRFIRLVTELNYQPDEILTITFTKKAAVEMKKRIVDALLEKNLFEAAQIAETGPIQTIHGFCERVLRENSVQAGIDPKFEILSETQSFEFLENSIEKTLEELDENNDYIKELVKNLVGKYDYNAPKTLHSKLNSAIKQILPTLRGSGNTPEEYESIYQSPKSIISHFQKCLAEDLNLEDQLAPSDNLKEWFDEAHNLLREEKRKAPSWFKLNLTDLEDKSVSDTCGLMQLVIQNWKNLNQELEKAQKFDFTELESRAVNLIKNCPLTQHRIQSNYKAVLIDESQDLNPIQYKLIDSLKISSEMMVGDPQQSIYRFRQADLKLFIERTQSTPCLKLSKNYRTHSGILKFIDLVFGSLWQDSYQAMNENTNETDLFGDTSPLDGISNIEIWKQRRKEPRHTAKCIQELISENHEPKDIAVLLRSTFAATELAEQLNDLKIENKISGGAEKFYTRLEIRDLANAFQCIHDRYDDFALLALLNSPIVGLSLDSIITLSEKKPVIDHLFEFNLPEESDIAILKRFLTWFMPLSEYAGRIPAWEALSEILHYSPFLENLALRRNGTQAIANVRKLLVLASDEPELSPGNFAHRIRNIQAVRHREGDAPAIDETNNAVTLMTIHKAKGLEFPVVVLPDMHQKLNRPPKEITIDPHQQLIATKYNREQPLFHKYIDEKRKKLEREEELRVLYVGMTRAKEKLCICAHPEGNVDTLAGIISKAVNLKSNTDVNIKLRDIQ